MPIYEYRCDACGERLEVLIRTKARAPQKCPKCGSKLRKLFSSPAIQFKGSGFYITDHPHKSSPSSEEKPAPAEKPAPEKKKAEAKSEPSPSST